MLGSLPELVALPAQLTSGPLEAEAARCAGSATSQAGEAFPALKQCLAVLGGEVPGPCVAQTISECLRWLKQSVRTNCCSSVNW